MYIMITQKVFTVKQKHYTTSISSLEFFLTKTDKNSLFLQMYYNSIIILIKNILFTSLSISVEEFFFNNKSLCFFSCNGYVTGYDVIFNLKLIKDHYFIVIIEKFLLF